MAASLFRAQQQRLATPRLSLRPGLQFAQFKQAQQNTTVLNSKDPQRYEISLGEASAASISETFQLLAGHLGAAASGLSRRLPQASVVKRTTAAAADAVLGSAASGPLRLQLRRRLRAAVAAVDFVLRLHATLQCCAYLSLSPCDLRTDAEALCSVDSFLGPVVPFSPLLRVTMALASITAFALKLRTASDWLQHPDSAHGALVGAAWLFDLITSGPGLMNSLKEIHAHIGLHSGRPAQLHGGGAGNVGGMQEGGGEDGGSDGRGDDRG